MFFPSAAPQEVWEPCGGTPSRGCCSRGPPTTASSCGTSGAVKDGRYCCRDTSKCPSCLSRTDSGDLVPVCHPHSGICQATDVLRLHLLSYNCMLMSRAAEILLNVGRMYRDLFLFLSSVFVLIKPSVDGDDPPLWSSSDLKRLSGRSCGFLLQILIIKFSAHTPAD